MYTYLLFIHILSAIIALAAVISYPIIMSGARTASQARFALGLLEKLAILPKLGGSLLLLTGLALGFMETYLFGEGWYVVSIVVFAIILAILAVMVPAGIKKQLGVLQLTRDDALPDAYKLLRRRSAVLEGIANLAALFSLLLMVFKPF
ncbi:DUF2269 family protein [Paenibacillus sacheonensis]|uniref:DUF2269 family protein n=1 Tax=Paenibacillus sacheonensis TaxID=742054 RepID=A0A7X4YS43_9BACL|nr:DUF2269 family protein [Paenibacillus sacheonensis]MBM7566356.1 putative membrane protein [Paenibacillus sacheonensis]NBC70559.1 DUF2269 family protein [Paenibacillus sacheonensis]